MHWLKGKWDLIAALLCFVAASNILPTDAMKSITTELIAFFSIQAAIILPAMVLTANILKSDGLELTDLFKYHKALKMQMVFWVTLLALDFCAVVLVIIGKSVNWSPSLPLSLPSIQIKLTFGFQSVLCFVGTLAILRTIPFVRGVFSLLDLNCKMVQKAIERRNRYETTSQQAQASSSPLDLPKGYGRVISSESGP